MNGPPISIAIIPATTIPNKIAELVPKLFKKLVNPLFKKATGGLTINVITIPINSVPNKGYNSTGLIPSSDCGKNDNTFRSNNTKYPAINPASNAPKNPAPPAFAKNPPTNPTTIAGRSAILTAINPAKTGNKNPNAASPTDLKKAANGVFEPKLLGSIERSSNRNAKAIKIPPATTNGNMFDTPFIKCLYN